MDKFNPYYEDDFVIASLSLRPATRGDTLVSLKKDQLCNLNKRFFVDSLLSVKNVAKVLKQATRVKRIALVSTSNLFIRLLPLHGLSDTWHPILDKDLIFYEKYPGYISSKSGPEISDEKLCQIQQEILQDKTPKFDYTFIGTEGRYSLFGKIVRGKLKQWRVWENPTHVAFLTPFGNTYGFTVVVPRTFQSSDILEIPNDPFKALMEAVYEVIGLLKRIPGIKRVGMIFEGLEVNYAHVKLIPLLANENEINIEIPEEFFEIYQGSVSSRFGPKVPAESLRQINSILGEEANMLF